jgi:tetratricopeptide (TPR) repeat protein
MKVKDKKNNFDSFLKIFLFSFVFIFLLINIYFSQNISPLYQEIVNNEKEAVISYLKKIKKQPFFKSELKKFTQIFNQSIAKEVFFEDEKRKIKIQKLKEALKKNPKSRDILTNLAILYNEDGNDKLAQEYFNKAKEIDPNLTIAIK